MGGCTYVAMLILFSHMDLRKVVLCTLCLFMICCTYTWFKCYCMSRWLALLLLAWCSHGYCDVIDQVIVIYLGSRVLSQLYLVL